MLDSLAAQTLQAYELVLVVGGGRAREQAMIQALLPSYPNARMVVRPNQETLANSTTALLPTLASDWIGFIRPRDCLQPQTLSAALMTIAENPQAKVVFTDEECRDALNRITHRFDKLSFDPVRLITQEYLRDLALINRSWLQFLGGFNPVTSEWPSHDIYLKTLESHGAAAFVHISERLYQRFRIYREKPSDLRRHSHLPGFDTQAIRQHFERTQRRGKVIDNHRGTAEIRYELTSHPWLHVFVILEGGLEAAWERLWKASATGGYGACQYTGLYIGDDPMTASNLAYKARSLNVQIHHVTGNLPAYLNQEIQRTGATYIALVRGEILDRGWSQQLLSHAQDPAVGVVGGKCISPLQLQAPGVLNYRYAGWDWNSRGKFNVLNVPHCTGAVSPANMLFSAQTFIDRNGFDVTLPTLFGMDFCIRVGEVGKQILQLPAAAAIAIDTKSPDAETALFKGRWSAWSDRYQMILPW